MFSLHSEFTLDWYVEQLGIFIYFSSVDQPPPQPQKILINPHFQGTIQAQPNILLKEAQVRQQVNDSHFSSFNNRKITLVFKLCTCIIKVIYFWFWKTDMLLLDFERVLPVFSIVSSWKTDKPCVKTSQLRFTGR